MGLGIFVIQVRGREAAASLKARRLKDIPLRGIYLIVLLAHVSKPGPNPVRWRPYHGYDHSRLAIHTSWQTGRYTGNT